MMTLIGIARGAHKGDIAAKRHSLAEIVVGRAVGGE